jgi:electron transfer flavoprotein alpha subunit
VADVIERSHPSIVLATGTDRGNEVMARVAARLDLPLAANVTEVTPGDAFALSRTRWGGSLLEDATLDAGVKLLTVQPHAVQASAEGGGAASVETFTPSLSDADLVVRVTERVERASDKISLADAKVVVGGGRGVGGADGFAALEELADLLHGAVGCSRVVTSLGWRPHSDQVGQTGQRIAPDLYIACGISGAIQHMVGCKSAKRLFVINTDPEAPILSQADYAIIGDARQVVTALTAAIRGT